MALSVEACEAFLNASNSSNATAVACETSSPFEPNNLMCIGLSACGGVMEVSSTLLLAYPEYKKKNASATKNRILIKVLRLTHGEFPGSLPEV